MFLLGPLLWGITLLHLARHCIGASKNRLSPFQKGTISSLVPCIINRGQQIFAILSTLGNMSPGRVNLKLKATLYTDKREL